jgi:hypothetical protein
LFPYGVVVCLDTYSFNMSTTPATPAATPEPESQLLSVPFGIDNGLNEFGDYSWLCLRITREAPCKYWFLIGKHTDELPLSEKEVDQCVMSFFFQQAQHPIPFSNP